MGHRFVEEACCAKMGPRTTVSFKAVSSALDKISLPYGTAPSDVNV